VHVYAQLVDDDRGRVLTGVSSLAEEFKDKKLKKTDLSREVGKLLAARAKALGVTKVVFDRAGYRYHGRVKALAEGAREGGLQF
jgi:large subunit ribosomal protein L18